MQFKGQYVQLGAPIAAIEASINYFEKMDFISSYLFLFLYFQLYLIIAK